ncbi:MAG: hypothetical protein KJO47_05370 [Gammaproteobacteria bacterium]|nr:hypothetical protein [Gammaproteobacteria bacterium]
MQKTLVLQSHQQPLPAKWMQACINSVKSWAVLNNFFYKFIDDEIFYYVSDFILEKTKKQKVIATDLARLKVLKKYLAEGYDTVVWCDADFLVFLPEKFHLPDEAYAVGREVWIQGKNNDSKKLTAHIKVHNAFMMFREDNSFLDFYIDTAERLLLSNNGSMPPQFIGPKLLTAIHNVAQCPVLESAGMLSPLVIKDITKGGGRSLELFQKKSSQPIYAANLCNSLFESGAYNANTIEKCIDALKTDKHINVYTIK